MWAGNAVARALLLCGVSDHVITANEQRGHPGRERGSTDPARLIGPDSQNWKSRFPVCLDVVQGQEAAEAREPSLHRSAPLCSSDGPRPGCFQLCCSSGSFSDV